MFPEDAPDGSAGAGAPVSDAQPGFPLGASRDATSRRIPPLPTTSEPDWAKPRRVAFCVGDDAAAVADAWAWTAARFLEPTDDVIMLRVWCPDAAAFRSDVDPDYAAEVDFHQERTTTSWLPPSVRDSLARREARPSPAATPTSSSATSTRTSPPRVRLPDTARAAPWTSSSSARDPVAAPSLGAPRNRLRRRRSKLAVSLPRPQTRRLRVRRRRGDRLGTGRGTLRGFRFDVAGVPGSPDFGPAVRAGPSRAPRGTFARPTPGTLARPTPRRVVIAVDGSDASSRAVRWCRDALLRRRTGDPRARRVGFGTRVQSRLRRTGRRVAARGGRRRARRRRDARRVARARTRARTRGDDTAVPEPRGGQGRSPGRRGGFSWARTRRVWLERFRRARAWRRLDKLLAVVAAKQGAYRCGWPPRGAATLGPPRDGALRAANAGRDLIVVGESRDGGVASRDVAERQHTHSWRTRRVRAWCTANPRGRTRGGKRGSASVTREDRFQISGPAVGLKPKTKFHR